MISRLKSILNSFGYGGKSRTVNLTDRTFFPVDFISNSYNERDFREFICVAFGENPYINMVVPRITDIQSSLPRSFKNEGGDSVNIDNQLERLLMVPNRRNTQREFYDKLDQLFKVTGNGIVYGINSNPDNSVALQSIGMSRYSELHIASIDDVYINTTDGTENGIPISYQISDSSFNGATITIDAKDVLHMRNTNIISPCSNYGLSPLFGQQKSYTASTATFESRVSSYRNGGATGVLSPKGAETIMLPQEREVLNDRFTQDIGGTYKFGSVYVSGSPVDFTRITISPEQLKLIESIPLDLRNICAVYDVDSVLFSDVAGTTFNNLEVARERILETAIRGGNRIDKALSKWLIQDNYGLQGIEYSIDVKDKTQEAKIEQRNTTEGKQQIFDISKAVTAQEVSQESGMGMLMELYAYSEEEANLILGL